MAKNTLLKRDCEKDDQIIIEENVTAHTKTEREM